MSWFFSIFWGTPPIDSMSKKRGARDLPFNLIYWMGKKDNSKKSRKYKVFCSGITSCTSPQTSNDFLIAMYKHLQPGYVEHQHFASRYWNTYLQSGHQNNSTSLVKKNIEGFSETQEHGKNASVQDIFSDLNLNDSWKVQVSRPNGVIDKVSLICLLLRPHHPIYYHIL